VEVLVAVFISAVSAGILMAAMPAATMGYTTAAQQEHAINLAEKEMESIRNQGFPNVNGSQLASVGLIDSSSPVAIDTYAFNNVDSANLDNVAAILPSGQGTVRVDTLNVNLVKVTIIVTWVSHGANESYELTTEMANL
jgi:Tfp pilus assembly protein PilV